MQKKIYLLSAIILCSFLKLSAQVGVNLPSQTVSCGQTFTIPVTVNDFVGMRGLQYSINWDTSQLEYEAIGVNMNTDKLPSNPVFNDPNAESKGQLSFLWFHSSPISLSDGDTIMLFTLKVKGTNFDNTTISFSNNPVFMEGNNGSIISVIPTDGIIELEDLSSPTVICPENQSATISTGNTSVAVENISSRASDNCGVDSILYQLSGATVATGIGDASGQLFNEGTTTVTYVVKDFKGGTEQCSFEVNVSGSGPIDTVEIEGGRLIAECGNIINIPINVASFDSVTSIQLTLGWDTTQFTYAAVDNFDLLGLTDANILIDQVSSGLLILNWTNITPQTKSDGTAIFNLQLTANSLVSNGAINLSNLFIERNNGLFPSKSSNGNITIQDRIAPTIDCPSNQVVAMPLGQTSTVVNGIAPTAMDNCGAPTVTYQMTGATTGGGIDDASGTSFNLGITTIVYTAVDGSGASTSCSFTVMVTGMLPTNFTLIAQSTSADCSADDITIDINVAAFDSIAGTQFSVNWDPNILNYTRTDNIQFPIDSGFDIIDIANGKIGYSWFDSGTETLSDGTTLFTLHFTPSGGGTSPVIFTGMPTPIEVNQKEDGNFQVLQMDSIFLIAGSAIITDNISPTIVCPNDTTIQIGMGQTSVAVNNLDPVASDNCGVRSISYTLSGATIGSGQTTASGQTFNAGMTTITYIVKDNNGNEQQCSSTVIVRVPNALQLNVINEEAPCGEESFRVDITVDSFTNILGLQFSVDWDETVLEFDSIGNLGLPEFAISNFTTSFTDDGKLAFAWFDSGGDGETLSDGSILFSIFYKVIGANGTATDIIIADDPVPREGNVRTNAGMLIVPVIGNNGQASVIDNMPPIVTNGLPDTIIRYVGNIDCEVAGAWIEPSFSDLCSNSISLQRSHDPNTLFGIGQETIKYTATDPAGNFIVDSTLLIIRDTIAPTITNCPTNINPTPDANCRAVVTWTAPTAADNCSMLVILSSTHNPGDTFSMGTTTVTYIAEDAYGNRSACSFDVIVSGFAPITFDNFPANITINSAQGQCGANIGWIPPTASGGCDNGTPITLTSTNQPGDFFSVGSTIIIYTATDGASQTAMDTFTITVIDNQDLVAICPTDIEIQSDGIIKIDDSNFINSISSDTCGRYTIIYNDITAFDNCSPIIITQTQGPTSGSNFTFGATMMEFVIADTLGNSRTCTFQIKIAEPKNIMASTPTDPTCAGFDIQLFADTLIGGSYQWTGPGGFIANIQNPIIPNAMTQNSGDYIVKVISSNGCSIKDTVSIGIRSSPIVEAMGNDIGCTIGEDTIKLFSTVTNGIPIQSYSWTGPGGYMTDVQNPIIPNATVANLGIYTVTGTSSNGCFDTDTVVINMEGMVMPTIASSAIKDTICAGDSFTLTGTAYDGIVTYTWIASEEAGLPTNTDTNVIIVTPTVSGNYVYAFLANLDGSCISDTARIGVFVADASNVALTSNAPLTCVTANETLDLIASGGTDIESYTWIGPNGFTSNEQNPSIPVSDTISGTYKLITRAISGCISTDSIKIEISVQGAAPIVTLSSNSNNVCEGDALALTAEDIPGVTYSWTGPNGFTSDERVILFSNVTPQNSGAYQVRASKDGCVSAPKTVGPISILSDPILTSDELVVEINQTIDFSVIENDQLVAGAPFTITVPSGAQNGILTNNSDGTFKYESNSSFIVVDQIAYEICYVDCPDLCSMETVTIRTKLSSVDCIPPTVITPNNDGMNDEFKISCVSNPPKQGSELIVFNEWGSEVFRESPYQNNWAGTYKGKDLPDGTYYYIYKEDSDDNDPTKGYFSLFR